MTVPTGGLLLLGHADALATLPPWARVVVFVIAGLVAAWLIDLGTKRVLRRAVSTTKTDVDELLLEAIHVPIVVSVVLAGVWFASGSLPEQIRLAIDPYVGQPTLTAIVVVWIWTLNRVGNKLLDRAKDGQSPYASFAPIFSNLLTFTFLIGGLTMILTIWNVDITPLLASAGIAGIAIGFAAKDTVSNFFGGLALYFDQTYRVGDYIELGSGEKGTVVKVGIRSTTLLTRDEVNVTVPNSVLNSARIINQSSPQRRKRIRVDVNVAYGTDIDQLEDLLMEITSEEELVLDSPKPRIRFLRFGDSALEYQIRCWVPTPIRETKATHFLNRAMYKRFEEVGIEIPYPKRDVSLSMADQELPAGIPEAAEGDD